MFHKFHTRQPDQVVLPPRLGELRHTLTRSDMPRLSSRTTAEEIGDILPAARLRMRAAEYLGAPALTAGGIRSIDEDFLRLLGEPDPALAEGQRDIFFLAATHAANSTVRQGEEIVPFSTRAWPVRSISALPYLVDSYLLGDPPPTPPTEIGLHIVGHSEYRAEDPALQQLAVDLQAIHGQDLLLQ